MTTATTMTTDNAAATELTNLEELREVISLNWRLCSMSEKKSDKRKAEQCRKEFKEVNARIAKLKGEEI